MGKIIEVKNLFKLYRVGDSVVHALNGVNFSINEGEFCAIVGTSGSGKSTLLNMLAGLEKPTKGEVIINGEHMEKLKEDQLVSFRRDHVGFIFQSFHLIGTMNAVENVALPLSFRGEKKESRLKKADKMLDLVNLKKHKKHLPNQMSGGQQQRVSIARALAMKPKMLFFDEPTSALDPELTGEILKVIKDLAAEHMTMVIVTHEMNFAKNVADKIIFMDNGYIVEQGTPDEVFGSQNTRMKEFLGKLSNES